MQRSGGDDEVKCVHDFASTARVSFSKKHTPNATHSGTITFGKNRLLALHLALPTKMPSVTLLLASLSAAAALAPGILPSRTAVRSSSPTMGGYDDRKAPPGGTIKSS